jgi:hypothetical protein
LFDPPDDFWKHINQYIKRIVKKNTLNISNKILILTECFIVFIPHLMLYVGKYALKWLGNISLVMKHGIYANRSPMYIEYASYVCTSLHSRELFAA